MASYESPRQLEARSKDTWREKRRVHRVPESLYRKGKSRSSGAHLSDSSSAAPDGLEQQPMKRSPSPLLADMAAPKRRRLVRVIDDDCQGADVSKLQGSSSFAEFVAAAEPAPATPPPPSGRPLYTNSSQLSPGLDKRNKRFRLARAKKTKRSSVWKLATLPPPQFVEQMQQIGFFPRFTLKPLCQKCLPRKEVTMLCSDISENVLGFKGTCGHKVPLLEFFGEEQKLWLPRLLLVFFARRQR